MKHNVTGKMQVTYKILKHDYENIQKRIELNRKLTWKLEYITVFSMSLLLNYVRWTVMKV